MTTNRRTLLRTGLTFTAALAARANTMTPVNADTCEPLSAGGKLSRDPTNLAAAAEDFGHIIQKRPQAVFKPASAADIAALMRWAGSRGMKVTARGQGHSTYGRAMADGGIVIDMSVMSTIHSVRSDRVIVDAGAIWSDVLKATLEHGLTPPRAHQLS